MDQDRPETGLTELDGATLGLLLELLDVVGAHGRDLETLLETFQRKVVAATGAERGVLLLLREDGELEAGPSYDHRGRRLEPVEGISRSLPQEALQTGQGICRVGLFDQEETVLLTASMQAHNLRSVLCVPLLAAGEAVGVLYLDSAAHIRSFQQPDLDRLQTLCSHLALHIQNARFWEERRRQAESRSRALESQVRRLQERLTEGNILVGQSPPMRRLLDQVRRVAATDATVLLLGETGTGKESLAHLIHSSSPRADKPLVIIDAGTIPETLLESELFGHEKGSFTGADQRKIGQFELADGGTVFLDEVGDLPQALQGKLLRVLEQRSIKRVGSARPIEVDIRVVAATNRDLEAMSAAGEFRSDLYFRLNVVKIELPPLRDRGEDRLALAEHFLGAFTREYGREDLVLNRNARERIESHDWPGNVREMKHRIQRAAILSEGPEITPIDLELAASPSVEARPIPVTRDGTDPIGPVLDRAVERLIREGVTPLWSTLVEPLADWLVWTAGARSGRNRTGAAWLLGIERRKLTRRLERSAPPGERPELPPELEELAGALSEHLDQRAGASRDEVTHPDLLRWIEDRVLDRAREATNGFGALRTLVGIPESTLRRRMN